ncbi:hypothetical protein C8B47_15325, partial [filamentous cyanobacterium CCP4]
MLLGAVALAPFSAIAAEAEPPIQSLSAQLAAADQSFRQGQLQHHKGNLEAALALYSQAIELNSEHVLAYVARGGLLGRLERYTAAIADYNAALEINPELAGAYGGRGLARYRSGETTAGARDLLHAAHIYRDQDRPSEYYST